MGAKSSQTTKKQFNIKQSLKYRRYYKTFVVGSGAFLIAFLISSVFSPVQNSDAAQLVEITNDATGWYITVDGSSSVGINVESTPAGQLASAKDTINVKTNSPFGYHLLVNTETANIYNSSDTGKTGPHFSPASGSLSVPAALTKDTWGFSLDEQSTPIPDGASVWSAVPTTATEIKQEQSANIPSGTDLDIYYAVNASTNLTGGSYTATIVYTAYSEGVTSDIPYMQDFTQAQCSALKVDTPTRLMDARDQKIYNVTKLKDGNCWMTSNLALDGGRTLTPSDSNVVQNRTLPANIERGILSEFDTAQIVKNKDGYSGNLYNWKAATATVGSSTTSETIYESICPRGWRLPDWNTGEKTLQGLVTAYGWDGSSVDFYSSDLSSHFNFPGRYYYNPDYSAEYYHNQGKFASFNSRTSYSASVSSAMFIMIQSAEGLNPHSAPISALTKDVASPVYCVYGENTENLMQNFTTAMCNNLSVSTASADNRKILMDSRDGKLYNISRLADNPAGTNNGTCWMVSNLALDGADSQGNIRTLTPSDSNVSADTKLEKNISSGTPSNNTDVQIFSGVANDYTDATEAAKYSYAVANDTPYGNLYNWFAATARTGTASLSSSDATASVCPKGWRLPDNGGKGVAKTWGNLTASVIGGTSSAYVAKAQQAPVYVALAGYYGIAPAAQGIPAAYWTRTPDSTSNAYRFDLNAENGSIAPQYSVPKNYGYSVRCVTE